MYPSKSPHASTQISERFLNIQNVYPYLAADHFIFAANSSSLSSVLKSPWYNRSTFGHTQCLRFRYIVYGPGAVRLRVMHRYDSSHFFVPVLDVTTNNQSLWRYAQTPIGSVHNYQVSIKYRNIQLCAYNLLLSFLRLLPSVLAFLQ